MIKCPLTPLIYAHHALNLGAKNVILNAIREM